MQAADQREFLLGKDRSQRARLLAELSAPERRQLQAYWPFWARENQLPPDGDWRTWLIMAGRGFGKTRAGSEWVRQVASSDPSARIALVASSIHEARAVLVEGESGILASHRGKVRPRFESSTRRLLWPNGAQAMLFSAGEPESLRGPQHTHAWCDEIAKWDNSGNRAMTTWNNLQLGLRLGERPHVLATTTPRAVPIVRQLVEEASNGADTVVTRGGTYDNAAHLSAAFVRSIRQQFARTALGRQELDGELLEDIEGALWSRSLIERCREAAYIGDLARIVVAVDPPASAHGDACGIMVCALTPEGQGKVLEDASLRGSSPEGWARAVAQAALHWKADRVVAEANQGGDMVASVLRAADCQMPLKLVHASRGKVARAEPVAALYESGRVNHVGQFAELEDELCGLMVGGGYEGPGRSPDRADALVWGLTELMLERRQEPAVREL